MFFKSKLLPPNSHWLVILDNDKPGEEMGKSLLVDAKGASYKVNTAHYLNKANVELEDILPKGDIQNAFDFSVLELRLDGSDPVDFSKEESVVSQATGAYKAKKRLTKEDQNLFEQKFKDRLFSIIEGVLNGLLTTVDIQERRSLFIAHFPQYHESLSKIILKASPKAEAEKT